MVIPQSVFNDHAPYLFHLVRLGVRSFCLQVEYFINAVAGEDVMTAPDSFAEPQSSQ